MLSSWRIFEHIYCKLSQLLASSLSSFSSSTQLDHSTFNILHYLDAIINYTLFPCSRTMSRPICQQNKDKVRRRLTFDDQDKPPLPPPTSPASHETDHLDAHTANEVKIVNLSAMTQQEKMEKMKQWNFDFENEIPLEGDWEWTATRPKPTADHKEVIKTLEKDKERVGDRNV